MSINVDQVLELARDEIMDELQRIIPELTYEDFTIHELIAVAAAMRPVYERVMAGLAPPARVLTLVPPTS